MGIPQNESIRLDTTIQLPEVAGSTLPALQRTDLQLLEKQKNYNVLEQQQIRAGALPTVAAFGSYNYSGFGKFGDNNLLKFYPSSAIGLSLQWNIFDGQARKARLSQKNLEFQQLEQQHAYLQENISMETENARNQIASNRLLLTAAASNVQLANKVLQQTALQLREGLADITDLLNAENTLREAQINYLSSLTHLRKAQLDMDKATGHLLD
jgi:outer membrane protein TolC